MGGLNEKQMAIYLHASLQHPSGLSLLVGIVGNSIAIHVCHRKQKRGNRFYILLLAVYDIIASVDTTISVLILNSYSVSFPSDVLCKVMTYFMWTTPSSSALMVLIIALQRFLLVFKPTKRYFDPRHHRIIGVLVVTFVPMVIAVPMCVFSGTAAINVSLSDGSHLTTCSCEAKTETKSRLLVGLSGGKLTIFLLLRRFHMVSNVVNPFVYGYFDITFRSYYAAVFRSLFCCRSSNKTNCLRDRRSEETDTDNTYY
uniref:G-protein coupled receptors family 1 profile domain-containing protein n=1 Tax=Magallana gigas TaxID=29159 RepID=A0A8W8JPW2_MAGGI